MKVIGHTVEVDVGVLVGPPGVIVGTLGVLVGVLVGVFVGPPGVLVGVFVPPVTGVLVAVLVPVAVAAGWVLVLVGVAGVPVAHDGREKVSFCPADNPPVLHSNWVKSEPVSLCTPTVAPDPLWVTVP